MMEAFKSNRKLKEEMTSERRDLFEVYMQLVAEGVMTQEEAVKTLEEMEKND